MCHSHSYFLRPKINFCSILPPFKTKLIQLSVTMSLWCWLVRQLGCKLVANRAICLIVCITCLSSSSSSMIKHAYFPTVLPSSISPMWLCQWGGSQNGVLRCNAPFYGLRVFLWHWGLVWLVQPSLGGGKSIGVCGQNWYINMLPFVTHMGIGYNRQWTYWQSLFMWHAWGLPCLPFSMVYIVGW